MAAAARAEEVVQLPAKLPILPFRNGVLLPGAVVRLRCTSPTSVRLVEQELWQKPLSGLVGVVPAWDSTGSRSNLASLTSKTTETDVALSSTALVSPGGKVALKAKGEESLLSDFQQPVGSSLTDPLQWHPRGVAARALHVSRSTEKRSGRAVYSVVLQGLCRIGVETLNARGPYHTAQVKQLDYFPIVGGKQVERDRQLQVLTAELKGTAREMIAELEKRHRKLDGARLLLESAPVNRLADVLVASVEGGFEERLALLDAVDLRSRLAVSIDVLSTYLQNLLQGDGSEDKGSKRGSDKDSSQLQQISGIQGGQMRNLQDPLGGGDNSLDDDDDVASLEQKLEKAGMPANVWKHAQREARRLRKMAAQAPGHASARQYLELLADLPWQAAAPEGNIDLAVAKRRLDSAHFGLSRVKQRILEYIAVRKLKPDAMGPVLCFVGPPGVGKTSLASSIATALGRRFIRISLGGVKDEADIRGHRRTYVGSMPGRLIDGIKKVGVNNPVMLLDEIDKTGMDARGDPAAALLEVLDPEQNRYFTDHYLGVPFDLSRVVFVATANRSSPIPPPLLDRMEVIELPGYTPEEKHRIAVRHLIPRVLEQNGITKRHLHIQDHMVETLIQRYTREAGVRNLSRHLSALARAAAVRVAESRHALHLTREAGGEMGEGAEIEMEMEALGMPGTEIAEAMVEMEPLEVDEAVMEAVLGPPKFDGKEAAERVATPGVAVGLVWTAVGGEVQFVEATSMRGKGDLHLTGQLGDVIKESAQIALTWVRSSAADEVLGLAHAGQLGSNIMDSRDIHIHFPAGAVPKDGPSAGVTLVTALVSLLTGRCVRSDTAMTGEITLRGLVLPVGGVKDKILAAHRCGIRRVILPEKNIKDLREVPPAVLACMEVLPTKRVEDVLHEAFEGGCPVKPPSKL